MGAQKQLYGHRTKGLRMNNKKENNEETYRAALKGKKLPILTMDKKWYKLFDKLGRDGVAEYEERLNEVIRKQGKLTNQSKDIKRLKKKLMNEIVNMASDENELDKETREAKMAEHRALIEECNENLIAVEEEGRDLPFAIEELNLDLMISTMESCYEMMHSNEEQIQEIEAWVKEVRIELKKKLIEKQRMEQKNQEIYKYMHDIFGADVVDLFDLSQGEF